MSDENKSDGGAPLYVWGHGGGGVPPELIPVSQATLRDWFAGMALQGMLSDAGRSLDWSTYAEDAYAQADAMLKARQP